MAAGATRRQQLLLGASKLEQLTDNLGPVKLRLTEGEVAALDAATPLAPVYPNWFIERLAYQPSIKALSGRASEAR